ncbi:hypothetical protein VP01_463g13 [Puccinia sorghi]|uniref:Wax synthase domain-containing protein n=1 Tax=Puccinia sorghi TaxID=27349 RepID=A0A0L6UQB1_9BASI|nr:hypothetical protein VP01_463g13 [Puccinia sorghi]
MIGEWMRVNVHVVPLAIQAMLVQYDWRTAQDGQRAPAQEDNPIIRWTRIGLVPISLGLLSRDQLALRLDPTFSAANKITLGCLFAGQFFKTFLFAFIRPPSSKQPPSRPPPHNPHQSLLFTFIASLALLFNGSSNPSKQFKLVTGSNTIRSDVVFLMSTMRRLALLNVLGGIGLYACKSLNDEVLVGRYPIMEQYKPQLMAVVWGVMVWSSIDLMGCMARMSLLGIKWGNALLCRWIPLYQHALSKELSLTDLEESCPFHFEKIPLTASSITDFWSRHWHGLLRDLFIEAGSIPLTSLVLWASGSRKPHPKFLRLCGIMGAFTVSAIVHEVGMWTAGPFDWRLRTSIFFISQGVGVCLENVFKSLTSRAVGGPLGRLWTYSWLVLFGSPMISSWMRNMALDQPKLSAHLDQLGFWKILLTPFILLHIISSLPSLPSENA